VTNGRVEILHAGVLVATHAQRLAANHADRRPRVRSAPVALRARDATTAMSVSRLADVKRQRLLRRRDLSHRAGLGTPGDQCGD